MIEKEEYRAKKVEVSTIWDEIKSADTSKYEPHPMVEKLLVDTIEELKDKVVVLETELNAKSKENNDLNVQVAMLNERVHFEKLFTWIRNLIGISLGISGAFIFSQETLLSKIGLILTPMLAVLFLLSCIFSLSRRK